MENCYNSCILSVIDIIIIVLLANKKIVFKQIEYIKTLSMVNKQFYDYYIEKSIKYTYRLDYNLYDKNREDIWKVIDNSKLKITEMRMRIVFNKTPDFENDIVEQPKKKAKIESLIPNAGYRTETLIVPEKLTTLMVDYDAKDFRRQNLLAIYFIFDHDMRKISVYETSGKTLYPMIDMDGKGTIYKLYRNWTANVFTNDAMYSGIRIFDVCQFSSSAINNWYNTIEKLLVTDLRLYNGITISDFVVLNKLKITRETFSIIQTHTFPRSLKKLIIEDDGEVLDVGLSNMFPTDSNFYLDVLDLGVVWMFELESIINKTKTLKIQTIFAKDYEKAIPDVSLIPKWTHHIVVQSNMAKFYVKEVVRDYDYNDCYAIDMSKTTMKKLYIDTILVSHLPKKCAEMTLVGKGNEEMYKKFTFPTQLETVTIPKCSFFNAIKNPPISLKKIVLKKMDTMISVPDDLKDIKLTVTKRTSNNVRFKHLSPSFGWADLQMSYLFSISEISKFKYVTVLFMALDFPPEDGVIVCPPNLRVLKITQSYIFGPRSVRLTINPPYHLTRVIRDSYTNIILDNFQGVVDVIHY